MVLQNIYIVTESNNLQIIYTESLKKCKFRMEMLTKSKTLKSCYEKAFTKKVVPQKLNKLNLYNLCKLNVYF